MTQQQGYREKVFGLLPSLTALDGLTKEGEEVDDSDSEPEEEGEHTLWLPSLPTSPLTPHLPQRSRTVTKNLVLITCRESLDR